MRRAAVVVGIDDYWFDGWSQAGFAESDARKFANALTRREKYGFTSEDVTVLTGRDARPAERAIRHNFLYGGMFPGEGDERLDLFVFYFAGHGTEYDGQSYLVPVDGMPDRITETCIPLRTLLERIRRVNARQRLLIFDICKSGAFGKVDGLPAGFAKTAENFKDAVILSSCKVDQASHVDPRLNGGVFTHFLCKALNGAATGSIRGRLSIFDVVNYTDDQLSRWASRHGCDQRSHLWTDSAMLLLLPVPGADGVSIPSPLTDRRDRTDFIVLEVRGILQDNAELLDSKFIVRICSRLSSFSITEPKEPVKADDREYFDALRVERDMLTELFERGAALRIVFTWSIDEILATFEAPTHAAVKSRMQRLKRFCEDILEDETKVKRAEFVHYSVQERNLLLFGDLKVFVGRRLRLREGWEATEVINDRERVQQEIELYDRLYDNARSDNNLEGESSRCIIERLIADLDRDMSSLCA